MSDIPGFPYSLLWEEKEELTSVANLTKKDGDEFLTVAAKAGTPRTPFLIRSAESMTHCRI